MKLGGRDMIEDLLRWLEQSEGPLTYLALTLAGAIEYVVPPFPGDTVTVFGTVLAGTAGYSAVLVYLCITGGAIGGSLIAYGFGLWVGRHEDRWPRWLRGGKTAERIHTVIHRFEKHGAAYLAVNRFLPAFRAVFFVAAGMAELPVWKVVVFGGLSAAVWNAGILALGWAVGHNFEELRDIVEQYTVWSLAVVGLVVVAFVVRWIWQKRSE